MNCFFKASTILLPNDSCDMTLWPSLACDQFTSKPAYWSEAQALCANAKSALHITLPEVYLEQDDVAQRIEDIHEKMQDYLKNVLTKSVSGFVYTERYFFGKSTPRCGIIGTVDLEAYSYEQGALPAIRPSENTVVERIPPRLAVRRNAPVEVPHILMLIDDADCNIIEPLAKAKADLPLLYNTKLMLDGGSVVGFAITDDEQIEQIETAIAQLGTQAVFDAKYPVAAGKTPLTMAVGDGNHSLATAKAYWEELKQTLTPQECETHPARHCLVELVNVHSDAIEIEPIHRAVFGALPQDVTDAFFDWLETQEPTYETTQEFVFVGDGISDEEEDFVITIEGAPHPLAVGTIELFLDDYIAKNKQASVDYIHGEDAINELASEGALGIILPEFEKSDLFRGVVLGGVLPRKTFSMGTATEKRYYLECRCIKA